MSHQPIPLEKSFANWRKDPAYRAAYKELEEEFTLAAESIEARMKTAKCD